MLGNYFKSWILERGYDYYLNNHVHNVVKIGNEYHAIVDGTDEYEVCIEVNNSNRVISMTCTCPYAIDGTHCKHEAATLIEIFGEQAVLGEDYFDEYEDDDYWEDDEDDYYEDRYETHFVKREYEYHPLLNRLENRDKSEILKILETAVNDNYVYKNIEAIIKQKESFENVYEMINDYSYARNDININTIINSIDQLSAYNQPKEIINIYLFGIKRILDFVSLNEENKHIL